MKTLNEQHRLIKEGKGHKDVFLKEAKKQFPQWIRNAATYKETTTILKSKGIINENIVSLEPINQLVSPSKESYEIAFNNYLEEAKKKKDDNDAVDAKAEEKEASKQVKKAESKNFDRKNMENPDNLIFDQIMKGYYFEMKDEKNSKKTMEELKKIVLKNLTKDPIYYTKKGQFGEEIGYETEAPGLGRGTQVKDVGVGGGYGLATKKKFPDGEVGTGYLPLKESHQPGDKVLFKGARYEVVDEDEFIITLKDEKGNIIKKNYNQFKQGETTPKDTTNESKLREVINTLIREELDESYDKDNNILYLNRVRDAIASNGSYEYTDDAITNTLDNPTRAKLLTAVNALNIDHIDLYSLIGQFDEDILQTLEDVFHQVDNEFYSNFTDPAGGSGLASHLEESKIRKAINTMVRQQIQENVQKELMQINKDAEYEVLASKVERINAAIEKRQSQLDRLDEDEDLKNLTDKKKLKELAKDIKILEKAKSKIEKTLAKKDKASKSQPEIIDDGMIGEADGDAGDAETTADALERAAKAAKEIGDTELFEEDENIDTENLKYE